MDMDILGPDTTDSELWSSVCDGNGRAFGLLFDRHRDRIFGHSLRLVQSPLEAEDVTAMVFLEAWRGRGRVRIVNGSSIGWLLVMTSNVAKNHLRSRFRYQRLIRKLPAPIPEPDHGEATLHTIELRERGAAVHHALTRLATNERQVLMLCVVEELSTSEVSELLRIPTGTVKSRLSRAKAHLGNLLDEFSPIQSSPLGVGEKS